MSELSLSIETIELGLTITAPTVLELTITPVSVPVIEMVFSPAVVNVIDATGNGPSITGEVPTGAMNGSNATFQTAFDFVPESVEVFLNGLKQTLLSDYSTSGNRTINLFASPGTTENLSISYRKQL